MLNVFKEAKEAYREKKAEIVAAREAQASGARGYKSGRAFTIDDARSARSSHRSHGSRHSRRSSVGGHSDARPSLSRRRTEGRDGHERRSRGLDSLNIDAASPPLPQRRPYPDSPASTHYPSMPRSAQEPPKPLMRSHTTFDGPITPASAPPAPRRSYSVDDVDMALAYGEPPPNLMTAYRDDDVKLRGLVGRAKGLLDEAQCLQHSVTTTMATLQKKPDAMAAVALTLAEISAVAKRMAPGTLLKVRALAPSVFALLTSPQFLIAAGVGVGITVIALGGFKVIRKIQAQKEEERSEDQMIALGSEVSRVETWRQGVADIEARSVGTSVEGELITPAAARLSRLNLAENSRDQNRALVLSDPSTRSRHTKSAKSTSSRDSVSSKADGSKQKKRVKKEEKPKPSPLRKVFSF